MLDLFRREVQGRAHSRVILVKFLYQFRNTQVANLDAVTLGEKHIQRLQVPVDDGVAVQVPVVC